jgi:hypothetical protein
MKFTINNVSYIISERKEPGTKPALFLLRLTGKSRQYVSSLYPTGVNNQYRFEYQQNQFILDIGRLTITPLTLA